MDRFTSKFFLQVEKVQKNLEDILTLDWGPKPTKNLELPFQVQTDLHDLETLAWSLPDQAPERSRILFARLAKYFEAGLELKCQKPKPTSNQVETWCLEFVFDQGSPSPLLATDLNFSFELKPFSLIEVRRIDFAKFLNQRKGELDFLSEKTHQCSTALLLRPTETQLWLLISDLPDLFLKEHISRIHEKTIRILSDLSET